ncbi:hypothetical protein SCHPADRAFT_888798 [Schizopora paradoxa]|uniref:Uncharacterized protein n=1 Tax=Schizopora paradoxa TaxID=27342 RepID=A0A0H2RSS3_9AGAM|nr:hypothetical protein SCHPADRAFT_888798 [Schizopora paradoxa]
MRDTHTRESTAKLPTNRRSITLDGAAAQRQSPALSTVPNIETITVYPPTADSKRDRKTAASHHDDVDVTFANPPQVFRLLTCAVAQLPSFKSTIEEMQIPVRVVETKRSSAAEHAHVYLDPSPPPHNELQTVERWRITYSIPKLWGEDSGYSSKGTGKTKRMMDDARPNADFMHSDFDFLLMILELDKLTDCGVLDVWKGRNLGDDERVKRDGARWRQGLIR